MIVLGLNNFANHDSGAAIVTDKNGKLEFVSISEAVLSRVKRPYFSPLRSIKYCMDYFNIKDLSEIDLVVADYIFDKQLTDTARHYRKLEHDYIKTKLKLDFSKVIYVESHHLAHAATAFYPSGFNEAAILVVDGFGSSVETNSIYAGDKKGIKLVDKAYGQGIGLVYEVVTSEILGFHRGQEGKTMGLAAYGENIKGKNILKLNPVYDGIVTDFSEFIDRAPRERLKQQDIPQCKRKEDVTNDYYTKIAYEVQTEAEKCLIHLANYAYKKTGKKNLCIAGGVGLNCVANSKILENTPFKEVFIQPAASDVGLALGLALCGYSKHKKVKVKFNVYPGKTYDKKETRAMLEKLSIPYKESNPKEVAHLLSKKNIVGWLIEGSELGPRALGHRSILADPRDPDMKDIVNSKVKHREMFRPFAPSILEEDAKEYFEMGSKSPYMLLAPRVKGDKFDFIPSVVHVDGLARVQTVPPENKTYYELIKEFKKITGVPVVLNTSFNDDGEPIVETPVDALLCFLRTRMDYLYIDGLLIDKKDIKEAGPIIDKVTVSRRNKLQKDYKEIMGLLCDGYSSKEMKEYLKSQHPTCQYYNNNHTFVTLRASIHKHLEGHKFFMTDKYHMEIIEKFMKEEFYFIKSRSKIVIIEDCLRNKNKIKPDSFVLLYNLSLYIKTKNVFNFYSDLSTLKLRPPYAVKDEEKEDVFEGSNEYNLSKDWDSFYNDHILR